MGVVDCECAPVMSKAFDRIDEHHPARYEILSHEDGMLQVRVYATLASGEQFTAGSAEILNECLYLSCATTSEKTISFELAPWELTYRIRYDGDLNLDFLYFQKRPLRRRAR